MANTVNFATKARDYSEWCKHNNLNQKYWNITENEMRAYVREVCMLIPEPHTRYERTLILSVLRSSKSLTEVLNDEQCTELAWERRDTVLDILLKSYFSGVQIVDTDQFIPPKNEQHFDTVFLGGDKIHSRARRALVCSGIYNLDHLRQSCKRFGCVTRLRNIGFVTSKLICKTCESCLGECSKSIASDNTGAK